MSTRACIVLVLIALGMALAGCGFTPVYGNYSDAIKNSPVSSALNDVYVDSIPDRTGQKLRNILIDRMYKSGRVPLADAAYRLQVNPVQEYIYGLGIAKDATATRSQINLTTHFTLSRHDGTVLIARDITAVSSFNTLASQYTTLVTEEDARAQTIRDLSDQIMTMLELYFTNPSKYTPPQAKAPAPADERMRIEEERPYETEFSRD
jgi:LPS-assembly lipoprotein